MGEALNETAFGKGLIARGVHYLIFNSKKPNEDIISEAYERFVQLEKMTPPWLFFSDLADMTYEHWRTVYKNIVSMVDSIAK